MSSISDNLLTVQRRIQAACAAAGRSPAAVRLLAVSKTFGVSAIAKAHAEGQSAFGENYIQEGLEKIQAINLPLEWHCIGPIQSNKTKSVAEHFSWVQSIDRLKIAQRLNDQRPPGLPPLNICLQVNVDGGLTKSGVPPQQALQLAQAVMALPALRLRGLMCIPEPAGFTQALEVFGRAKSCFDALNAHGMAVDTLSMGMSADLEAAIQAGSTMVRVGTAIFGQR
jgi:pyridoxal phosphate enzyme (YggS family)